MPFQRLADLENGMFNSRTDLRISRMIRAAVSGVMQIFSPLGQVCFKQGAQATRSLRIFHF